MARRERQKKKILLLLGALVVLAVAGVGALQLKKAREAQMVTSKRASGLEAHLEGRHEAAMRDLGYVFQKQQDDVEVAVALAESRRAVPMVNNRHLGRALQIARLAAQAAPDHLEAHELLMSLHSELGQVTERLEAARQVQRLDPEHRGAIGVEIDSLRRLGQREEAYARAKSFYDRYPRDPEAARLVIDLMIATEQSEADIIEFMETAIAAAPDVVRIQQLAARVYGLFNRLEDARQAALRAADMDHEDAATLATTIQLLDMLRESEVVDQLLEREASDASGGDMATVVAASRAWKDARLSDAVRRLEAHDRTVADASSDLLAWRVIILDEESAAPSLAELRSRDDERSKAWVATLEARSRIRSKEWTEAANLARRALELDPSNEVAYFLLGETERAVGDWRGAVSRWRDLRVIEPRWLTLRLDLISALLSAGEAREAYDEAFQTFREWPDRLIAAQAMGRAGVVLLEQDRANPAERSQLLAVLTEIERQATDPTVGLALLTRAHAALGDAQAARETLGRLLDSPSLPPADDLVPLIEACRRHEVFGVSELVAKAMDAGVREPGFVLSSALVAHANGRSREGESLINNAIAAAEDPGLEKALQRVGALYLDRIGDSRALEALREVAEADRTNPEAQLALLNSRAAWTDRAAVRSAIGALREASSEGSSAWKVFEARELLTFEPTEQVAAQIVTLLQDVVRREPQNIGALTYLGEAYAILKDHRQAARMLSRAVDAQGSSPTLLARLIELLQAAGESDQAETRLRAFAQVEGLSPEQRERRAQLLLRQNMLDLARRDLEALSASGDVRYVSLAAQAAARAGDTGAAEAAFTSILERPDRTADAVIAAADFLARFEGFGAGLSALDRLPASLSDDERAMVHAGFHQRHGMVNEADRRYAALATRTGNPEAWTALVRLRAERGDASGALAAVQEGLSANPGNRTLELLAMALDPNQGASPNDALLKMIESLDPDDVRREPLERYLAARRAIAQRPNDVAYATNQLRSVIEEYPSFFPAWRELAETLSVAGRAEEAATVAREAASRLPNEAAAAELATRALAIAGRFDEALSMSEAWSARLNDDPYPAQLFQAAILRELGRNAQALALLEPWRERILLEAEQAPVMVLTLAGLLAQTGRIEEAGALFEPLVAGDPEWAVRRLSIVSSLMSRPTNARQWLERWAPSLPNTSDAAAAAGQAWYNLATSAGDTDMLKRSIEPLQRAMESPRYRLLGATMLAGVYEQLEQFSEAERHYRIALEENPNEAVVLNNLAYLLIRTGGSAEEAVTLAERCIRAAEEMRASANLMVNYLDTLGAAYAYARRFEDAVREYQRALERAPENAGVLLGLAEARLEAGDAPGADEAISRLLTLRDRGRLADPDQRERLAQLIERSGN